MLLCCGVCVGVLSQHLIVCKGRSVQLYTFKVPKHPLSHENSIRTTDTSESLWLCVCCVR